MTSSGLCNVRNQIQIQIEEMCFCFVFRWKKHLYVQFRLSHYSLVEIRIHSVACPASSLLTCATLRGRGLLMDLLLCSVQLQYSKDCILGLGCFFITHRTLAWTTRSLACAWDLFACIMYTRRVYDLTEYIKPYWTFWLGSSVEWPPSSYWRLCHCSVRSCSGLQVEPHQQVEQHCSWCWITNNTAAHDNSDL